jgi:hypothetical protein
MTLHVIGIIANFKSILVVQVRCAKDFVAFICCARCAEDFVAEDLSCRGCCRRKRQRIFRAEDFLSRRGFCRAEDFVAQSREDFLSFCRGFCRAEDFVAQRILSRRGFCRAEDAERIFSRRGFCHAEDFVTQRIFLCTGYRARCVNDWFSGQLQDHFLTNWRGILKIPERFLSRTNQIIKTSLIFEKRCHILGDSKESLSPIFQFS